MNQKLENIVVGEHYSAQKVKDFILHVHMADPPEIDIYHLLKVASPEEKEVVFQFCMKWQVEKAFAFKETLCHLCKRLESKEQEPKKQH